MQKPKETEYARGFRDGIKAFIKVTSNYMIVNPSKTLRDFAHEISDPRFIREMEAAIFLKRSLSFKIGNKVIRKGLAGLPGRVGSKRAKDIN